MIVPQSVSDWCKLPLVAILAAALLVGVCLLGLAETHSAPSAAATACLVKSPDPASAKAVTGPALLPPYTGSLLPPCLEHRLSLATTQASLPPLAQVWPPLSPRAPPLRAA
jgi:hypothetical protein